MFSAWLPRGGPASRSANVSSMQKRYASRKKKLPHNPKWLVAKLNDVAVSLTYVTKDYKKALDIHEKALFICERNSPHLMGDDEYNLNEEEREQELAKYTVSTLCFIMDLKKKMGDMEGAREAASQCQIVFERAYGHNPYRKIRPLLKLGQFYYEDGDLEQAEYCMNSVITLDINAFGLRADQLRSTTVKAKTYLGYITQARGNHQEAVEKLEEAWAICRKVLGVRDTFTLECVVALGRSYFHLKEYLKAKQLVEFAGYTLQGRYANHFQHSEIVVPVEDLHKQIVAESGLHLEEPLEPFRDGIRPLFTPPEVKIPAWRKYKQQKEEMKRKKLSDAGVATVSKGGKRRVKRQAFNPHAKWDE